MAESSDQEQLRKVVVENSVAENWLDAKREWHTITIFDDHDECACECGHRIVENCIIENRKNGNRLTVGNVCVNHFDEPDLEVKSTCRQSLK